MKILHIVAGVWKNSAGLATLVLGFSREQAKAGHQVSLVFLEGDRHEGVSEAEEAGVRVQTFKRSLPHFLFFSWGMLFGLRTLVREADVVHVHSNWTFPVWWGGYLALRCKKILVMSPQGCFDPVRLKHSGWKKAAVGWMDRWLLRRASVIHATCEAERGWIEEVLKFESSKVLKFKMKDETGSTFASSFADATADRKATADKHLKLAGALRCERPKIVVIPNGVEEVR